MTLTEMSSRLCEEEPGRAAWMEEESERSRDIAEGMENAFLEEDPGRAVGVVLPMSRSRDIAEGIEDRDDGQSGFKHLPHRLPRVLQLFLF